MSSRDFYRAALDAYGEAIRATTDAHRALMSLATGADDTLHWESTGNGVPVLMIMGLGLSGGAWWRTVPVLSERLRVITYDNRGVGRSRSLVHSYTTEAMADDAVSVLDAAGLERAHVYGFSLGGMVAQQLALRHPHRIRSLVLGATHAGGPRAVAPDAEVLDFFRRRPGMQPADAARASVPFNYGERCRREHADRIEEDIRRRLAHPFPEHAYRAQLYAATLHDCESRLGRIEAPTLVVHGRNDRMIPVANAETLAAGIPGARLRSSRGRVTCTRPTSRRSMPRSPGSWRVRREGSGRARGGRRPPLRARAPGGRRAAPRHARAHLRGARRPLEPARAGAARRRSRARIASRLPRPHRARGRRAPVRRGQARRGARAAQLAPVGAASSPRS